MFSEECSNQATLLRSGKRRQKKWKLSLSPSPPLCRHSHWLKLQLSTVAGRWHHSPYGVSQAGRACPPRKGCDTSRQLIGRDRGEKEEHQSSAGTDAPLLSVNAGEGCSHCQRCVSARSKHLQRPQCQQGWGKQQRNGHRTTSCLSVLTHQIPTFFTQQPPRP